jgi:hypothetical protein
LSGKRRFNIGHRQRAVAELMRVTMAAGIPAGPSKPNTKAFSNPGKAADSVGSSSIVLLRFASLVLMSFLFIRTVAGCYRKRFSF